MDYGDINIINRYMVEKASFTIINNKKKNTCSNNNLSGIDSSFSLIKKNMS